MEMCVFNLMLFTRTHAINEGRKSSKFTQRLMISFTTKDRCNNLKRFIQGNFYVAIMQVLASLNRVLCHTGLNDNVKFMSMVSPSSGSGF